jgi:polysaccharide export outer membrane protein
MMATACAGLLAGCGASLNSDIKNDFQPQNPASTSETTTPHADRQSIAHLADSITAPATPGNTAYKIGPQDVLDISVFKVPDLSRNVQVADTGTVNLPLVGEVTAAGKTSRELEQDLAKRLGAKYLQSPQVSVYIKEYNSRRVTVDGAVGKPGIYPITGKTSLLQIIAMAGGPGDASDNGNIVIFRQIDGQRSAARFDLDEIRAGNAKDPALREGDVVIVNASAMKAAFQNVLKALPVTSMFVPLL